VSLSQYAPVVMARAVLPRGLVAEKPGHQVRGSGF
jgi:hypothetical protein